MSQVGHTMNLQVRVLTLNHCEDDVDLGEKSAYLFIRYSHMLAFVMVGEPFCILLFEDFMPLKMV